MTNTDRNINKIIKELSIEEGFDMQTFSFDWIIKVNDKYIVGYNFDINSSAASAICNDKAATYEVLNSNNISAVVHDFFMAPKNAKYLDNGQGYTEILNKLKKYKYLVLKPNNGTSGEDIFLVNNEDELKERLEFLFTRYQSIAISPFINIDKEYRIIVLDNEVKLIFSKNLHNTTRCCNELVKFNLCHGAIPEIVEDEELIFKLSNIALKAVKIIGINFASVDIVDTEGQLKVLEVNSGVMMEHFSRKNNEYFEIAKGIYRDAIKFMLK